MPAALQQRTAPTRYEGEPEWSAAALHSIGLPEQLIAHVEMYLPHTDPGWMFALYRAFEQVCGRTPAQPHLVVGSAAAHFAAAHRIPTTDRDPLYLPSAGNYALTQPLTRLQPGVLRGNSRTLHLIVDGDESSAQVAGLRPQLVSWQHSKGFIAAVRAAFAHHAILGYMLHAGSEGGLRTRRTNPMDLATIVRHAMRR